MKAASRRGDPNFQLLACLWGSPHPVPGPVLLQHHSLALIWSSPGNPSPKQQSVMRFFMALEEPEDTRSDRVTVDH